MSGGKIRPGAGIWPALSAACGLLTYASVTHLIWPQLIGCAVLGMLGVSLVGVRKALRLDVRVETPRRVRAGGALPVAIELTNRGRICRALIVRHRLSAARPIAADAACYIDRIAATGTVTVNLDRAVIARGFAHGCVVEISTTGAFGFFTRSTSQEFSTPVIAHPAAADAGALHRTRAKLDTPARMADVDLRGVTDWHSGAQLGDVHWRSLARSGRPAVLERERATPSCLVVVVMAAPTKHGRWRDDPGFERAVSVAAAALSETARTGEPTCLVAPETSEAALGRVPHTGYGSALLDRLARLTVTAEPQPALMRHAVEHAGRGGNVLLVANNATPGKWVSRLLDAAAKADVNVIDARKVLGQADSLAPVAGPR